MTNLKLATERAPDSGRHLDTPDAVRRGANAIANQGRRVGDILGRGWTTESSEAEAIEGLVRLACAALTLREELMKARAQRNSEERGQ